MRSNPRLLLWMVVIFASIGVISGFHAYRSGDVFDKALAALWLLGAVVWLVRFQQERRWRDGR